jgi:hypothetical protein
VSPIPTETSTDLVPVAVHHIQVKAEDVSAAPKDNSLRGFRRQTLHSLPSRRTSIEIGMALATQPTARTARRSSFSSDRALEYGTVNSAAQRLARSGVAPEIVDSIQALLDAQCLGQAPSHTKQTVHSMLNTVVGHGTY